MKRGVEAALVTALVGVALACFVPGRAVDGLRYRTGTPAGPSGPHRPGVWCGTTSSATDRLPEAAAGRQVHVVYAFPSDVADASAARAPAIVADLTAVGGWWRGQDPARTPRFDLFAFPGCPAGLSQLDLATVRLQHDSAFYAVDGSSAIQRLSEDLSAGPAALADPEKKYLVYFDGPVADRRLCGIAFTTPDLTGRLGYAIAFLGSSCGADLGAGGLAADTAAHELTHDLGAVPPGGPPHACPADEGHVCDGQTDLMYPFVQPLAQAVLDIGRDDYYGHSGTWWDVQDSPFLKRLDAAPLPLTVTFEGDPGAGAVESVLPGIDCPGGCAATWDAGTVVTLNAVPANGARFTGWGGACKGQGPCTLTMDAARAVSARFALLVSLRVTVVRRGGRGSVRSSTGETCSTQCELEVHRGLPLVLTAVPASGSRFRGWTGACSGRSACRLTPGAHAAVAAAFAPASFRIAAAVTGRGKVASTPAGITCPGRCGASFAAESSVWLRATPAAGWRFSTWSGDCSGRGACIVKASRARSVRATFRPTA